MHQAVIHCDKFHTQFPSQFPTPTAVELSNFNKLGGTMHQAVIYCNTFHTEFPAPTAVEFIALCTSSIPCVGLEAPNLAQGKEWLHCLLQLVIRVC